MHIQECDNHSSNSQTILRQFSDLRQPYDNWQIHRTILRQNLTITFWLS